MTFVSYAQNFEDVMLWRALGHVPAGFYIDVGAANPDVDSVTLAFYDRGWHGINIEPLPGALRRIAAARPRDINLCLALGAEAGHADFLVVEGADQGLSTLDVAAVDRYTELGFETRSARVDVSTLAAICRLHAPDDIHFLKIDVEGAEESVLRGADFDVHRPWIIVIEAVEAITRRPTHDAWEPALLRSGYRHVWFDGLNRFYVAEERADALCGAFAIPVNVFDDVVRVADSEIARRIASAESRAAGLAEAGLRAQMAAQAQAEAALARADAAQIRAEATFLRLAREAGERAAEQMLADDQRRETARLRDEIAALTERARVAADDAAVAQQWLAAVRRSTSWRLTRPLRAAVRLASSAHRRQAAPTHVAAAAAPAAPPPPVAIARPPPVARPPMVVHQFHSGSAVGDAITNAMRLTRRVLRDHGYDSEIFVEHLDSLLADELFSLDDLPTHGDFVLIVRHSMGHDVLDRILAHPARKVLLYHNITPPEFLDVPILKQYAAVGRQQLDRFVPHVAASLADSEYNAIELRTRGMTGARACTLLFDLDEMIGRPGGKPPAPPDKPFTILFVGRVSAAKGQRELIEAFAAFVARATRPARLVLVGRHGGVGDAYLEGMQETIRHHSLDGLVEITGLIDDDALHDWYRAANLYVSLSRHEGFGVPLVEAIAHGVPVLAWPCGAVPYTLGGADGLLADRTPTATALRMLDLARDAGRRLALAHIQRAALDRFSLTRQTPTLIEAIRAAGAAPPRAPDAHEAIEAGTHVVIAGHVKGSYSLAAVNRDIARAIEAERPGRVRVLPVEGAPTRDIAGVPIDQRAAIQSLVDRPAAETGPVLFVSQHYPVWAPRGLGDLNAALFYWEESLIPSATVDVLNAEFHAVLAPSRSVAKALIDSGVTRPVRVVGHAPDLSAFRALAGRRTVRTAGQPLTFLHVSSCFPRKGVDVLLAAYRRAFRAGDAVRLIVKGFPNPHNDAATQIEALRKEDPDMAPIELIDRDLGPNEILALYERSDVMVLPTRGEGFNLPAAEALASGLRLIVTGHGGHLDFIPAGAARLVDYRFAPSRSHLATPHSVWAEPDVDDLTLALREAVTATPASPRAPLIAGFVPALMRTAADLLLRAPEPEFRLAVITSWAVRCGVAEYARLLLTDMARHHQAERTVVLADTRTRADPGGAPRVRPCWALGERDCPAALLSAVMSEDPHVVLIQHQPGLLDWPVLANLLRSRAMAGRAVLVTLHNTRQLIEVAAVERGAVVDALATASRVLVHTIDDLGLMKSLGLIDNVTLLPHGTQAPRPVGTLRALTGDDRVAIASYGFFLPGKGIAELIAAFATLRHDWPKATLRLVNAVYPARQSADEIQRCRDQVTRLGLAAEITFETEFLPTERSLDLLADSDLIVLPYQFSKEASSAAVRTALAASVPVLVTPLPLFDELGASVLRLSDTTPKAIAGGMADALTDLDARTHAVTEARGWMEARSWPGVARRLQGMMRGLLASDTLIART